ncbi:DNA glycosylase [Mycena pura]|uniref:Adenine DNA glycosylase n=1 Tax=Mycena pura TaxID=153505 RepID=A0AAD6VDZ3_9AGAR|nr:DNA glycosylase [Mycena pura]
MGKRKLDSDDDFSDSDYQFYASSEPKTRKKRSSSRPHSDKKTRHKLDASEDLSPTPPHTKNTHTIKTTDITAIRSALLQWYSTVHDSRNMPWRKRYDPTLGREGRAQRAYEVWISEIMLQQTQVATVIPYYNRWIEKFPTIRDLAIASIDEVNALWKGLGYYSRASRLLTGAQKAVSDHTGRLPDNAKDLQAHIPGIGRYSAGAISSIAYGENAPVLDGNVTRLLSRLLALHASPKAKTTLDILWAAAAAMVDGLDSTLASTNESAQYPGDINQALIELGSTVCKVRDPNCTGCPLRLWCAANTNMKAPTPMAVTDIEDLCAICVPLAEGADVTAYPLRVNKKKVREEFDIVNVVEWRRGSDRRFLLVRRPQGGLLAGLDEFPTTPNVGVSLAPARLAKIPQQILSTLLHASIRLGDADILQITKVQPAGDVVHVFSHIKKTYRVQWVLLEGTPEPPRLASPRDAGKETGWCRSRTAGAVPSSEWVPLEAVAAKNITTGVTKIWNLCRTLWEKGDE